MALDRRIQCRIVDEGVTAVTAHAFRILEEVGDTFFLDFLHQDQVVSRVRMQRVTLAAVRDRLVNDVFESDSKVVH